MLIASLECPPELLTSLLSEGDDSRMMRALLKYAQSQQRGDDTFPTGFTLFLVRCSTVCKSWRRIIDSQVSWYTRAASSAPPAAVLLSRPVDTHARSSIARSIWGDCAGSGGGGVHSRQELLGRLMQVDSFF
jgi:hypothetical protein